MELRINLSDKDLHAIVRLALVPAMLGATRLQTKDGRVSRHFRPDGDFYVHVVPLKGGTWSLDVCDDHGGEHYASVQATTIEGAIRDAANVIGGGR